MDGQYNLFDKMQKNLGIRRLTSEQEYQNYLAYKPEEQMRALQTTKSEDRKTSLLLETEQHEELKKQIVDMLMIDEASATQLSTTFRLEADLAKNQHTAMQKDANASGVDKLKHDFFGSRKRAAKRNLNLLKLRKQQLSTILAQKGQVTLERQEYVPADGNVKLIQKDVKDGFRYNPLRVLGGNIVTGFQSERRREATFSTYGSDALEDDVQIPTAKGVLCGRIYKPIKNPTGKVAIVITGRGGTNADMSRNLSASYLAAGAAVVCVDMRGFGKSYSVDKDKKRTGTYLSAAGRYADAREIYDYVKTNMANNASDIIVHGYSLGGGVASKLAADIAAENAQKLAKGQKVTEKDRLGGLVLSSPVDKFSNALSHTVGSTGFGKAILATGLGEVAKGIAYTTVGGLNTEEHLRTLHKYDANIPVMFTSGEAKFDDFLSLDTTHINHVKGAEFRNSTSETGMHDHGASIGKLVKGKMHPSEKIIRMVKYGRGADLVSPVQKEAIKIDGLPQSGPVQLSDADAMRYTVKNAENIYELSSDPEKKTVFLRGLKLCMKQSMKDLGTGYKEMKPENIVKKLLQSAKGFSSIKYISFQLSQMLTMDQITVAINQKAPLALSPGELTKEKIQSNLDNINTVTTLCETEIIQKIKENQDMMELLKNCTNDIMNDLGDLPEEQRKQVADLYISKAITLSLSDKAGQFKFTAHPIKDSEMGTFLCDYYATTAAKHLGYFSSMQKKYNDSNTHSKNAREKTKNAILQKKYGIQLDDGESERLKARLGRVDGLLFGK